MADARPRTIADYSPARYLLRFDDLCPTQSRAAWAPFQALIEQFALKPILAVIPDNRDPELQIDSLDPDFWSRMRMLEAAGATIALHGYQHLCHSKGKSFIPLHRNSEFAGVSAEIQQQWIAAGLTILRGHGLNPRLWVAPRHGFDRETLAALRSEGIGMLSDGFARIPFTRGGLTWIPQQLWAPVEKTRGLWTICLHANSAGALAAGQLRDFLGRNSSRFTSITGVLSDGVPARLAACERALGCLAEARIRIRLWKNIC